MSLQPRGANRRSSDFFLDHRQPYLAIRLGGVGLITDRCRYNSFTSIYIYSVGWP